jgi:hypothetical protein
MPDEQPDLDLVAAYLRSLNLATRRFSVEETQRGLTPDLRVERDAQLVAFCEVKSPNDPWLDELVAEAPRLGWRHKPDPTFNRLSRHILAAGRQFAAVNASRSQLNILAYVKVAEAEKINPSSVSRILRIRSTTGMFSSPPVAASACTARESTSPLSWPASASASRKSTTAFWIANFMHYDLGFIDLEQKTLQPLDNPFGPRLFGRAVLRDQSPAEGKEHDRKCREGQADCRKVKESKGVAFEVLANNGNQQIRRSADLGYGTTNERTEGERHEIG